MSASSRRFTIKVPATSANIGPGFDVVGLSLSLYLTLSVTITPESPSDPSSPPTITYSGEGAKEVPLDVYKNLTTRVALYVLRCHGIQKFPSNIRIHADNEIPFGRGLGSSGAAVIAGVLLGDALGNLKLTLARMLDFALMVERHPDNVTAALVGGFVGSYLRELDSAASEAASVPLSEVLPEYPPDAGENWGKDPPMPPLGIGHFVKFGWAKEIRAVAIIPRFELSTAKAREVLPETYSRKDVIFNLQRLAVLTTALAQSPPDPELTYEAMKDRVHQPYRKTLIPGLPDVTSAITPESHQGLLGICLSGAGPTILALATKDFAAIAEDARKIFMDKGVEVDWRVLDIAGGSTVVEEKHSVPEGTMPQLSPSSIRSLQSNPKMVAVDLDDVLVQTNAAAVKWHNNMYPETQCMTLDDFHYYHWWKNPGWGNPSQTSAKVRMFYASVDLLQVELVPGAMEGLLALKDLGYRLMVVTTRNNGQLEQTMTWINRWLPDIFESVHLIGDSTTYKDSLGQDHQERLTKGEVCRRLSASLLIDDAVDNVLACVNPKSIKTRALLFGDYEWGKRTSPVVSREDMMGFDERQRHEIACGRTAEWWKEDTVELPEGVWRVRDWAEVVRWVQGAGEIS